MSTLGQNSSLLSAGASLNRRETAALPAHFWAKAAIVVALLGALFYRTNLQRLWTKANPFTGVDANWGHAFIIPLIGLYYLYVNREKLLAAPVRPLLLEKMTRLRALLGGGAIAFGVLAYLIASFALDGTPAALLDVAGKAAGAWGLLILVLGWGVGHLVFGLLVFVYGIWPGQNDWVKDLGMVLTLFGVTLTLCGWQVMRVAWFPIAFLVFALPWPTPFYSWIASPLQEMAARAAVKTLQFTGVLAFRSGTKIIMETTRNGVADWRTLNVAEACAGLRSLMTFLSLAAAVAFLSSRPLWQKIVMTVSAVPIAIFCNVMRVAGQGLLDHYVSPRLSESFAHAFVGLVMLTPAFFLILAVGWVMDNLFLDEVDDKERLAAARAKRQAQVIAIPRRNDVPTGPRLASDGSQRAEAHQQSEGA